MIRHSGKGLKKRAPGHLSAGGMHSRTYNYSTNQIQLQELLQK